MVELQISFIPKHVPCFCQAVPYSILPIHSLPSSNVLFYNLLWFSWFFYLVESTITTVFSLIWFERFLVAYITITEAVLHVTVLAFSLYKAHPTTSRNIHDSAVLAQSPICCLSHAVNHCGRLVSTAPLTAVAQTTPFAGRKGRDLL